MSKLIKRKDGSYSKRGLWDNIRANKGSGKKPTKEMLKQESKIKKEESMNSMYKKGGKASKKPMKKESFMEESKELHFGAPGVNPPKKFGMGGKNGDPLKATSVSPSAEPKPLTPEQLAAIEEMKNLRKPSNQDYKINPSDAKKKMMGGKKMYKKGGAKTMEPGGGGRFAAMVGKLKGQGKSEESAEAIAASAGRKKYGKSRFQSMAAAGKKKMGGKKC